MNKRMQTLAQMNETLKDLKKQYNQIKAMISADLLEDNLVAANDKMGKLSNIKSSIDHMENYEFHIDWSQR